MKYIKKIFGGVFRNTQLIYIEYFETVESRKANLEKILANIENFNIQNFFTNLELFKEDNNYKALSFFLPIINFYREFGDLFYSYKKISSEKIRLEDSLKELKALEKDFDKLEKNLNGTKTDNLGSLREKISTLKDEIETRMKNTEIEINQRHLLEEKTKFFNELKQNLGKSENSLDDFKDIFRGFIKLKEFIANYKEKEVGSLKSEVFREILSKDKEIEEYVKKVKRNIVAKIIEGHTGIEKPEKIRQIITEFQNFVENEHQIALGRSENTEEINLFFETVKKDLEDFIIVSCNTEYIERLTTEQLQKMDLFQERVKEIKAEIESKKKNTSEIVERDITNVNELGILKRVQKFEEAAEKAAKVQIKIEELKKLIESSLNYTKDLYNSADSEKDDKVKITTYETAEYILDSLIKEVEITRNSEDMKDSPEVKEICIGFDSDCNDVTRVRMTERERLKQIKENSELDQTMTLHNTSMRQVVSQEHTRKIYGKLPNFLNSNSK